MKSTLLAILLIIGTTPILLAQDKIDEIGVIVKHYKHVSNGAFHRFLSLTCSDRSVEYISGFDYEWGYDYELKLKRTQLASPPEDGGNTNYELIKIESKTPVPDSTKFTVKLYGFEALSSLPEDEGSFVFNEDFTCTYLRKLTFKYPQKLVQEIKEINQTEKVTTGKFMVINKEIHLLEIK